MSRFAFPDLTRAFRDGERFGDATMRVVEVDHLVLPTGRIVACDPGYLRWGRPYTRAVPPGRYPVLLALLSNPALHANNPNYETVACAMVRFQEVPVERWEMALQPGWDPSTLKPGFLFGYNVDSGTACFVDAWTTTLIEGGYPDRSEVLDPATGANIVCFPSGYGDGCYASYFGFAADGSAACLVTDFDLLIRPITRELELPVPVQEHIVLMHPDLAAAGVEPIHIDWDPAASELVVRQCEEGYLNSVLFENRPGQQARLTMTVGSDYHYHLDEPLQPTARVRINYTLRTESL